MRAWSRKNRLRINARRRQRYRQNLELMRAQNREWYAANREKFKQWSREYRAAHQEKIRAKAAEYTRRNRHKIRTHNAVRETINTGRLVRGICEVCEARPQDQQIYAHHEDYSRPLDVRWLCRRHHHQLHAKLFCLLPPFEEYYAGVPRGGQRMSLFGAML